VIPRASTRSALLEERIAVPRNVTEKLFSSHSITLLRCPAEPAEAVVKSVMQAVAHAVEQ
jgi:hypothetical protein